MNQRFSLPSLQKLKTRLLRALLIIAVVLPFFAPSPSEAFCFSCRANVSLWTSPIWKRAEQRFDRRINREFLRLERFIIFTLWGQNVLPILLASSEQFTTVAMQQIMIVGMFIDAENQLETQQLLQELQARAHKDYHPSEGMCAIGSSMKALAASDMRSKFTSYVLSQRSQDRQMGIMASAAAYGNDLDKDFRMAHFKNKFCNVKDRAGVLGGRPPPNALDSVCADMKWDVITPEKREQINKDIDFFSSVDAPWTVKVDFTNPEISQPPAIKDEDEEHIFALAANLFASDSFARAPAKSLEHVPGKPLSNMQQAFMDMRSVIAKRSVAENSFNAIVGMKAHGVKATNFEGEAVNDASGVRLPMRSRSFMEAVLVSLGVGGGDTLRLLGENPSYDAQMQILTKKIFQNPDFYTDLYGKPADVKRKQAALQAIKMMQKFDMLEGFLRSEASFSVLLELAVVDLQREIETQISELR